MYVHVRGNGFSGERMAERRAYTLVDDDSAKGKGGCTWEVQVVSWEREAGSPKASKLNTEADG